MANLEFQRVDILSEKRAELQVAELLAMDGMIEGSITHESSETTGLALATCWFFPNLMGRSRLFCNRRVSSTTCNIDGSGHFPRAGESILGSTATSPEPNNKPEQSTST